MPRLTTVLLLEQWASWGLAQKPRLVRRLSGGLNNNAFLIQSGRDLYVLKVFKEPAANNIVWQNIAAEKDLAPTVLFSHPDGDYSVMHYLDTAAGETPAALPLAHSLAALHAIEAPQAIRFNYAEFCEAYLSKLMSSSKPKLRERYRAQYALLKPALNSYTSDTAAYCFSHNDLVQENCFLINEKIMFIDWDYAALNNPWFDLASLVFYFDLSASQSKTLLETYWQLRSKDQPQDNAQARFAQKISAALCAVIWLDILWFAERSVRLEEPLDQLAEKAKFESLNEALEVFKAESLK